MIKLNLNEQFAEGKIRENLRRVGVGV